jgi:hypothetical protein
MPAALTYRLACAAALIFTYPAAAPVAAADDGFIVSYTAGGRDKAGYLMGGTELRNLAVHQGKLYAGNGYWEDRPGPEGLQPAQVLVLDAPGASWRVERNLDERLANGRPRHLAISALHSVSFETDGSGRPLAKAIPMLLAGTWDLSGGSEVFSRDETNGAWTAVPLPVRRVSQGIQQVRAIAAHRDRQTGVDAVFLGNDPYGILMGSYDERATGHIKWNTPADLDIAALAPPSFPGLSLLRVMSLAECNGILYATVGQQIYRRMDGAQPRWELLYTNPKPGYSESGLRGLTAVPNPAGTGEVLLAAVEGTAARMVRIDPATGQETTELDIQAYLGSAWQTKVGYAIGAYNDMTVVPDSGDVLIGIEAFLPPTSPVPAGHARVDGLDADGWYFVRHRDGRYDLKRIGRTHPVTGTPLVATRAIAVSPFAQERDAIYFAGYDANKKPAHNTAWIFRAEREAPLAAPAAAPR